MLAAGALVGVVLLAAGAVLFAGAGTTRWRGRARHNAPDEAGATELVRNATPQPDWEPHHGPVPILEYHELGEAPAGAPYPELFVPRPEFRHELEWLDGHGYEAVTLEEVEDAWYGDGTLPAKPVVLSFDDGYRPQFTFALPQLRKHGWPGVLNLKAEGSDLYESNVKAMLAAGWELASHTVHHSDLTTLDAAGLSEELSGSRRMLQREYGVPVENFCYPAGEYDEAVIAAVEAAGYEGATTEIPGYAQPDTPYELARFEILGSSGVAGMAADLGSG
ncbi:MAG TPA: polysaccharide deacetylase family protein [Solirubrobacterales bacterium]|nr:polysaccharide deacetylase family protein [Solirubrobacterales bacterium]